MDFFFGSGWDPIQEISFDGLNLVFHYIKDKTIPVQGYNRPRGFKRSRLPDVSLSALGLESFGGRLRPRLQGRKKQGRPRKFD